ncbi:MAG: serine hydrolase, partial [Flavobacteriaceae bacterium]|nr:serine hydrolase [Flavobacteriaceae bacterium]
MRFLSSISLLFVLFRVEASAQNPSTAQLYYPGNWGEWDILSPEAAGFDPIKLQEAIDYAISMESENPRNMEINHYGTFGREPFGLGIGPFKSRGEMTGIVVKNGYIVAEWGEPFRVDMTHSVTKSFLSTTVGLAWDAGLFRDVQDPVAPYMAPILVIDDVYNRDKGAEVGEAHFLEPFQ